MEYNFTLPIPPSANRYWRVANNRIIPYKRGDLDNFTKVMFDSLKSLVWLDDSQVIEIHSFREDDKLNPRVEFLVYEIGDRK